MTEAFTRIDASTAICLKSVLYADVTLNGTSLYLAGGNVIMATAEQVVHFGMLPVTSERCVNWAHVAAVEILPTEAFLIVDNGDRLEIDEMHIATLAAKAGLR